MFRLKLFREDNKLKRGQGLVAYCLLIGFIIAAAIDLVPGVADVIRGYFAKAIAMMPATPPVDSAVQISGGDPPRIVRQVAAVVAIIFIGLLVVRRRNVE